VLHRKRVHPVGEGVRVRRIVEIGIEDARHDPVVVGFEQRHTDIGVALVGEVDGEDASHDDDGFRR